MTQRDDAARMVSHDPLEPNERQSVTRPISSVHETVELPQDERRPSDEASLSAADAGRGERPTLMGLAPVELDGAAAPRVERPKSAEPETSTVMPAHWLADAAQEAAPQALAQHDASTSAAVAELEADEQPAAAAGEPRGDLEASMFVPSEITPVLTSGDTQKAVHSTVFEPSELAPAVTSGDAQKAVHSAVFEPSELAPAVTSGDAQEAVRSAVQPSMFEPSENMPVAASGDADARAVQQREMFDEARADVEQQREMFGFGEAGADSANIGAEPSTGVEQLPTTGGFAEAARVHGSIGAEPSTGVEQLPRTGGFAEAARAHGSIGAEPVTGAEERPGMFGANAVLADVTTDVQPAAMAQPSDVGAVGVGRPRAQQPEELDPRTTAREPGTRTALSPSMFMPVAEHARLPEEGESEWLDLSTRWLVTSAPRAEEPIAEHDDDNEVTDAYWSERLSARVTARPDSHSSAPPPPQSPQLPGTRRATMTYGRPSSPASPEPQNLDAPAQRPWAPSRRRQSTLAGISPLPEDPNAWPPARESVPAPNDARYGRPSNEPNPWREEPSYSDAPRPQAHAPGYAAPTGTIPPWAGNVPPYAMQPQAAGMPGYAPSSWNGGAVTLPPPWTAPPTYGVAVQHLPPTAAYAPSDRRATRTRDYALPPVSGNGTGSMRPVRPPQPQQPTSEISIEQWKGMANTWFMTVGKLALAAMALHFSGLAKPLLANFGYAPASASTHEPTQAASSAAASLAAPSVVPEGLSPEAADDTAARRGSSKRESSESSARRHAKPHKAKPKQPKAARTAAAEPAVAAPGATTPAVAASTAAVPPAAPVATAALRAAVVPAAVAPAAPVAMAAPQAAAVGPAESTEESPTAAISEAEEAVGEALLRINSRPWSEIFVDGIHVGHTPKLDLRVSAGNHRIRLVNQDLDLTKTFEVNVAAGETLSHVELFID